MRFAHRSVACGFMRMEDSMRLNNTVTQLLVAASVAAFVPLGAAQAQQLQSAELGALIGKNGFEFRGQQTMWKFAPDGKVTADDNVYRATQGGMGETWGMKNTGTWRTQGNQLCIKWQNAQSDQCYTVTRGQGRMVTLAGSRTIAGTIDARDNTGLAEQPGHQYQYQPYQRIPGAR
jgi:hypothetical protein